MNCLETRRRLLESPEQPGAEAFAHLEECAACRAAAHEARRFEMRLAEALRVEPPAKLEEQRLLRHSYRHRHRWRGAAVALAASLLLAATLVALAPRFLDRDADLGQELLDLVAMAPFALVDQRPIPESEIRAALAPLGLSLVGDLGRITFVGRCIVNGVLAGHLVVRIDGAPVTVFLIPERLATARTSFAANHWAGTAIPEGPGTIGIVGRPGEPLEELEAKLRESVRWRS